MPLNKLENFIKNTDGRTLYVNPADLNATDSITNQGTSLTEPFRTVQRALIEAARFSYVRGDDNDLIEKTTIILYPGEHTIDNRPGYGIRVNQAGDVVAVSPSGQEVVPSNVFNLASDTNFDIDSPNNILWHFNSIYGGVIVPRGTSIVGMDLRKTKIRPKYVPNPTDPTVDSSAIFRITGTCYFWQFTIFDGAENSFVFTDPRDFSTNNRSKPTFSHHKLTAFEYADGVNPAVAEGFEQTDLAMYYSKLTNAYNEASGRPIDEKFPIDPLGFAPRRPEFEIVGAFATDPVRIASLISGDGFTPDAIVTVDTVIPHGLDVGTPIKIRGVAVSDYNISTKVASVLSATRFTYSLSFVRPELPPRPSVSSATVTVETDTVTGASPYIFNVSMRSVFGINGMLADGSKATGFRSMVVAQFTAISLQKDDRAFVKYNDQARRYDGINISTVVRGADLAAQSSSTNTARVYHLDPGAIYRPEWGTTHIKMSNDAVIQIVSVFAIGFNQHFGALSGADASITNSNSNFGQFALLADGFKNDAFDKDDKGFISQIITPNNAYNPDTDKVADISWVNIDFSLTNTVNLPGQLYLLGYTNKEDRPPFVSQGFRIGANYNELINQPTTNGTIVSSPVRMVDNLIGGNQRVADGSFIARKVYPVLAGPGQGPTSASTLTLPVHGLLNGEKIRIFSDEGDLPENIEEGVLYYANVVDPQNIRISTSESNALNDIFLDIYGGTDLRIESRVNDKESGDFGHPIQYDEVAGNWFVYCGSGNDIFNYIQTNPGASDGFDFVTYYSRKSDNRSLDDKLYRLRYVIPKETVNAKPPTPGYVIQQSSDTGARDNDDFTLEDLTFSDYGYNRNPRYIVECTSIPVSQEFGVRSEIPHNLSVGDKINILNVTSTNNPGGSPNRGYNGEFLVTRIDDARNFRYSDTDTDGFARRGVDEAPGTFTNDTNDRNVLLPRFQRKDDQANIFVYRVEQISEFVEGIRDGAYHLFCINGSNAVTETFTGRNYNQPIEDLYPQLDIDNIRNNPESTVTYANLAPLGKVTIDEKQNSITRETLDKLVKAYNTNIVSTFTPSGSDSTQITFEREHEFNGVYGYSSLTGGSNFTDGTFFNVKLLTNGGTEWKGASCRITVAANTVIDLVITDPGSGYQPGETAVIDTTGLGPGASGAEITITADYIEDNVGTVLQFTAGGSVDPSFYSFIESVDSQTQITIPNNSIPSTGISTGMYALPTDQSTGITTYQYDSVSGLSTFQSGDDRGFGLQRGNSFVAFDATGNNLGKFYIQSSNTPIEITSVTEVDLTGVSIVGKCGFEDNDASTGPSGENIGVRGAAPYDGGTFWTLGNSGTGSLITIKASVGSAGEGIKERLFLGRYVQVGSEIMRVASTSFGGIDENEVTFIRGALGTNITNHPGGSKIRAINPLAIELRRPSILRASGHTFEYLGYGPGNYSTSLPQLQVRQLPEEEVILVQAQELACGQVVYTGMSDNGDFYIGNTKYSATSGTQVTFDVPIPTVAGQSAASNNVVFDEVIVNRRLFVAGGETNEVLSQFDGPVKFTQSVTIENQLTATGDTTLNTLNVASQFNSISEDNGGALTVRGGAAVKKDLYVGGDLGITGDLNIEADLNIKGDINLDGGSLRTNSIEPFDSSVDIVLYSEQTASGNINVGSPTGKVVFETTIPGTGQGGDDVTSADGGVIIEGSLVVKEKVIAKEFIGDGLGKPGSIVMWGGDQTAIPDGYLLCNGQQFAASTYPKLAAAIGTIHGGTAASPAVPDLRERFIVGSGGNNPTVSGGSYSVGATGGEREVTLVTSQLPSHTHSINTVNTSHAHTASGSSSTADAPHSHPGSNANNSGHNHGGSTNGGSHGHTGNAPSSGSNHSHTYREVFRSNSVDVANDDEVQVLNRVDIRNQNTTGGGNHSHAVSVGNSPSHSHGVNITGGNHAHPVTVRSANARHDHGINVTVNLEPISHTHTIGSTGDNVAHENRPPYYALCYIIQAK